MKRESPYQRYNSYSQYLRKRFGTRVRRACIDPGLSCPNLDGTISSTGCLFCDRKSFTPTGGMASLPVKEQVALQIDRWARQHPEDQFIAYFQNASNTYGPAQKLLGLYHEAIDHPKVVGLAVATRPDCVPDEILSGLRMMGQMNISIELGLQIANDQILKWLRRGHTVAQFIDASQRIKSAGLELTVHLILGLPGQTQEDLKTTAKLLNQLEVDAVKIHSFHIVHHTPLSRLFKRNPFPLQTREEYIKDVTVFLEYLSASIVIQRLLADVPAQYLQAPLWMSQKQLNIKSIEDELERRDSYQGKRLNHLPHPARPGQN